MPAGIVSHETFFIYKSQVIRRESMEIAIFAAYAIFSAAISLRFIHMFQLSSYQWGGFRRWMRGEGWGFPLNYIPFFPRGKAKKPLVLTSRAWRLLITLFVLLGAAGWAAYCFADGGVRYSVLAAGYLLLPFLLVLGNVFLMPVQAAINSHYIRDARKMLRPGLIIIGITGSYGKTSVKNYITQLLSLKYNVLATPASFNTPMGVVRAIRENLQPSHSVFVCEMGARHIGNIKELCGIVKPGYGVLTAIGPQHLETFKTIDNIANTKFELIESLPPDGEAFLSWSYPKIRERALIRPSTRYAAVTDTACCPQRGDLDIYAENLSADANGLSFDVVVNGAGHGAASELPFSEGERERFTCALLGRHNAENVTAAIAVALKLGISLKELVPAVRLLKPAKHRLEMLPKGDGLTVIDDAYNSNPEGAAAALEALSMFSGTKVIITPGMVELGEREESENFAFGEKIAAACDYAALVGERQAKPILAGIQEAGYDPERVKVFASFKEAYQWAESIEAEEKVILLENDLPDNY
jgi:UDP-N-acetylmuramoyl-tripeptide--D-alanyl-D-alanine ligase